MNSGALSGCGLSLAALNMWPTYEQAGRGATPESEPGDHLSRSLVERKTEPAVHPRTAPLTVDFSTNSSTALRQSYWPTVYLL